MIFVGVPRAVLDDGTPQGRWRRLTDARALEGLLERRILGLPHLRP